MEEENNFNFQDALLITFYNAPNSFTKLGIKQITINVIDWLLDHGLLEVVDDGVYHSTLTKYNSAKTKMNENELTK